MSVIHGKTPQPSNNGNSSLTIEDQFLTTAEAADYLRIPTASLLNMTSNGKIRHFKFGRRNRYRLSDLKQLLLANPKGPEGGAYGN